MQPDDEKHAGSITQIRRIGNLKERKKMKVTLAGIGMDGNRTLTKEAAEAISRADALALCGVGKAAGNLL